MIDLQPLFDRILEAQAAAGIDMREAGADRWRGDCPRCRSGDDRLILQPRLDGAGVHFRCHGRCQPQDVLNIWGLSWADLRLDPAAQRELQRRSFDLIKPEAVRFLVPDRIPIGAVTLCAGDPKVGKSTFAALVAAKTTTGAYGEAATVAFINAEDSAASVTGPRLKAAGAKLELVEELSVNVESGETTITLPDDVDLLDAFVTETNARLIVLDPLYEFLSERAEANRDHSVRRALVSLRMMAERHGVSVLVLMHLNKDEQKHALYRVGGTIGFVALARSLLVFAFDPDDSDGAYGDQRLLAHAASNWARLAPTLRYRVEEVSWEQDGELITTTKLVEDGESDLEAAEIIGRRRPSSKTEQAASAIVAALAEGPRLSSEVKAKAATAARCGHDTIERATRDLRAQQILGSLGSGPTTSWYLLTEPPESPLSNQEEVDQEVEKPVDTGDSEPPPDYREGDQEVDQGVSGNGPLSDRERALEAIRRYREQEA